MNQESAVEILERATVPWPSWLPIDRSAVFQSVAFPAEVDGSPTWLTYSEARMAGDADLEASIAAELDAALAGTRIRITGSEAFVARVLAAARAGGAIDAEIFATVEPATGGEIPTLRFFCLTCSATYAARVGIGDLVRCPTCQTKLLIDHRFSSHQGAFLTWQRGEDP
jgi:DNA-directed RNA polymerase subunit RPC12/RpoP/antitoxin (DNA-binding transcriptional repressor) of toxin-antitoxin stability system